MKRGTRTQHLTDAEFSDMLAGERPDVITQAHLDFCDYCRSELDSVSESLASFQGTSSRWAEMTAPARISVPSRWSLGLAARPAWLTGLAATALTGVVVFLHGMPASDRVAQPEHPMPAVVASAPPSTTELANDNRLMVSIDQELGYQSQTSAAAGTLHSVTASQPGSSPILN